MSVTIGVRVEEAQAARWQRALVRGQERGLAVRLLGLCGDDAEEQRCYQVRSYSRPDVTHTVALTRREGTAVPLASCSCEAGQAGTICQHAALALHAARWCPFPLREQTVLEIGGA